MKKKVVLVIPPIGSSGKEHLPILSIGYVASSLEKAGYEVKILDSIIYGYNDAQTAQEVLKESPDAVGITCTTNNRFNAFEIIKEIKKNNKNIFVFGGGRHFHHTWQNSLNNIKELDVIVRGEGELTTPELLNAHFGDGKIGKVLGIAFRSNGKLMVTPDRPVIKNLDEIAWPAWHLFDLDKYSARLEGYGQIKSVGVISSRGCPNQCTFCANNSFWPRLRLRSPKDFVDEVEFLHKTYGYKGFDFWDDTITMVKSHVLEICEEILKRKLDIIWYARARVNTVDREILEKMKQAGCRVIGFGVESGSEKILKNIKKNISIAQIKKTFLLCAEMGFISKAFFIHGLPGETEEDILKTKELTMELKSYGARYKTQVFADGASWAPILYPGTEMLEQAIAEGTMDKNFDWTNKHKLDGNADNGLNPYLPIYKNKNLKTEEIIKIVKKFDRRPSIIIKNLYFRIRVLGAGNAFKKLVKKIFRKLG